MYRWEIAKASIVGRSHEQSKKPNQDTLGTFPNELICDIPLVAVISDGHGANKYYRSDIGADIAVKSSIAYLKLLVGKFQKDNIKFQGIRDYCIEKLAQKITLFWKRAVRESIQKYQYTEEESNIYIPYGCTVLGLLFYENILITFQLGDGDILLVNSEEVTKEFGKDENLIANETYSLCMKGAEKYFNVNVKRIDHSPPELILISTDGYSNSFKDDESFYKAGKDFLEILQKEGIQVIRDNLDEWLKETSNNGSGDDTTMILLHRVS